MRIALALFFLAASAIFALGGFDILNNAADFEAESQIRFVGFSLIAIAALMPLLAGIIVFFRVDTKPPTA